MILPGRPRLTLAAVPGSVFRRPDRRRTLRAEPHSNALIAVASRRAGIRMRALRTGDSIMFENLMATAVLPASDLDRARRWWHDVLDRDPVHAERSRAQRGQVGQPEPCILERLLDAR